MRQILLILILSVVIALFSGCKMQGNTHVRGGEISEELLGLWTWDDDSRFEYYFFDDGTGIRGWLGEYYEQVPFLWSTMGNTLLITCQGSPPMFDVRNERWTFRVTGYSLRLISQQSRNMLFNYTREGILGDVYLPLVGTWLYTQNNSWRYVFNEDGTGRLGWLGEEVEIVWGVTGHILRFQFVGMLPKYSPLNYSTVFSARGNLLYLSWNDGTSELFIRDRRVWEPAPALADTWVWDDDHDWVYILNPDGTGTRGFPEFMIEFTWGVYGNAIGFFYDGVLFDSWLFEITGNSMRLESPIDATVFTYTRESALPENIDFI